MRLIEVLQDPSLVENEYAFETAMWYFDKNKLWDIADEGIDVGTIEKITRRVNGGIHGLYDRIEQTQKIHGWLDG
jgi:putative chitinase